MSTPHGCNDGKDVVATFKEALLGRVGHDRYQMWFAQGVDFDVAAECDRADSSETTKAEVAAASTAEHSLVLMVRVRGQFALDRLRKNFLRELRGAAMQAIGAPTEVQLCLDEPPAEQVELPLGGGDVDSTPNSTKDSESKSAVASTPTNSSAAKSTPANLSASGKQRRTRGGRRGKTKSISSLIAGGAAVSRRRQEDAAEPVAQMEFPQLQADGLTDNSIATDSSSAANFAAHRSDEKGSKENGQNASETSAMSADRFVVGSSNQLAYTAMQMVFQNPRAASPLFLCGPTGIGKTHMMTAIAQHFRRRLRMRRVMHLSAEQFTNDFISSVGNSGIAAFRRRYREVDALLIDDVQFLGAKKATIREMMYTVETLAVAGRPLVFSGLHSPTDIQGLSHELAGRMAAGLVCSIQPLDASTRESIFRRWIEERCPLAVSDEMIQRIVPMLSGDGRVISGVVNLINTLQRMHGRCVTMDELRQFGGDLLRAAKPVASMSVIESAVCEAFHLPHDTLRSGSQSRTVTEPRMLAMYLSRQLTASAYAEIARHFGGKSHSTAISAENNVKAWLESGKAIGRGHQAITAKEAIDRIETRLRTG